MNSLAVAYAVKRRNQHKAMGGFIEKAEQACAHGGPVLCNSGCYDEGGAVESDQDLQHAQKNEDQDTGIKPGLAAPHQDASGKWHFAKGGMAMDPEGEDLDLDFDESNESLDKQVLNEDDNPIGLSEDESEEMSKPKKSRLLSRILGSISRAHLPS